MKFWMKLKIRLKMLFNFGQMVLPVGEGDLVIMYVDDSTPRHHAEHYERKFYEWVTANEWSLSTTRLMFVNKGSDFLILKNRGKTNER